MNQMSKTALLSFSSKSGKWEATSGGKVLVSSPNKKYVQHVIEKGLNAKARDAGVTKIEELGMNVDVAGESSTPLIEFDVNERFTFLADYVDMVSNRDMKSVIIVGEGGLGKSFTVLAQLAKNGLKEHSVHSEEYQIGEAPIGGNKSTFIVIKGYSTSKGLYRSLYENRNRLVIFDDCDSVLRDDSSVQTLKAALDSYDKRIVTWNAETVGDSDLPKSFEFTGGVIFISNLSMHKIPQALISRSAAADVSMTRPEIISRMRKIVQDGDFMDDVEMSLKIEALDYIGEQVNNPQVKTMNLRTLISVVTNRRCKPSNWKRLSLSMMMAAH